MIQIYLSDALGVEPASKPKLYRQIYESAEFFCLSYGLDLVFAAGIATLGLVLNSPAVVIGAMLISPLMGPILAAGLAFAASDVYLGVKALIGLTGSILVSISFSAALVWLLPFQSPTAEILARTQPNLLDLGVAIFSGLAGSFVMARSLSGGPAGALPGVAIAVALMPPLCTAGFGVGSGWNWQIISGAGLLFLTNLVAIAASAFFVFYLLGMDSAEIRSAISEAERRQATGHRLYALLHDTAIGRGFGEVGQLRWRILMVAITIAVLFVPLRTSLLQLKDETLSRAAAREAVKELVSAEHVLSQQVEIFPDQVIQRIVTTTAVPRQKILAIEADMARRTGKNFSIQLRQVANEDELISLKERLRVPDPPPAPVTLQALGAVAWPLVDEPINAVWPSANAQLIYREVAFSKEHVIVRLGYESQKPLDAAAQETIENALRGALKSNDLKVIFEFQNSTKQSVSKRKK